MFDLQMIKEDEKIIIGVRSSDFLGNPMLNEYVIEKSYNGYNVTFCKVGLRNQKYSGVIQVDRIITNINGGERKAQLVNFICNNSEIVAETVDKEFKMRLKHVIYYKILKKEMDIYNGTEA